MDNQTWSHFSYSVFLECGCEWKMKCVFLINGPFSLITCVLELSLSLC